METPLKRWRRRCGEGWIDGLDPVVLCDAFVAFEDERARHPGAIRVQLCESRGSIQLAGTFAALTDPDPVDAFVTPGHGLKAELDAFEAAVRADYFWTGGELVSCGRRREERPSAPGMSRLMVATGGTSSGLRFAAHTWTTLESAALGLQTWLGGEPIDSVCMLPLHHVSGLMQAVRSYVSGGVLTLWDWPRAASGEFPRVRENVSVTSLVPTQVARLLELRGGAEWLRSFRCVFLGGAAAWPALSARMRAERLPIVPCYGMTESAAQVTALGAEDFLSGSDSVGTPLPHAAIDIVDDTGELVAHGQSGRVRVRAASLFFGYHPEASARQHVSFVTNDRGRLDASGRLTVLGRIDALINTGGEKVDPHEVEGTILALGAADVAVFGLPDERWGEIVVAIVAGCAMDDDMLRQQLRQTLPVHKVPKRFVRVASLPRSEAGKLDRRALRDLAEKQGDG